MKTPHFKPIIFSFICLFVTACGQHDAPTAAERLANDSRSGDVSDPISSSIQAQNYAEETFALNTVSAVVRVFQVEEGRWPSSLKEMVDKGYLTSLPPLPSGKKFAYDPKGGRVEVVNEGAPDIIPSNPSEDTEPATVRPSSILPPETPASSAPVEPSPGAIPQE